MKYFSEIIVLFDNIPMPNEELFCPSFWKSDEVDSDGDYYWDGMSSCWTNLKLVKTDEMRGDSSFELNVYREKSRKFEPSVVEVADLARYVSYRAEGRYAFSEKINNAVDLGVASFMVATPEVELYKDFLETVHFFLSYSNGIAANFYGLDAKAFRVQLID